MLVKLTGSTVCPGAFLRETKPMYRSLQERMERTRASLKLEPFNSVIKPLEKAAAQKGSSFTLTSFGKTEAICQAGKRGFWL